MLSTTSKIQILSTSYSMAPNGTRGATCTDYNPAEAKSAEPLKPATKSDNTASNTGSPDSTAPDRFTTNVRLNLKNVGDRLKTYVNWPVPFMQPLGLAKAGFYYFNKGDIVRCVYCKTDIGNWKEGDDPMRDHQQWVPNCPFVKNPSLVNEAASYEGGPSTSNSSSQGFDTCGPYGIEIRPFSEPENGMKPGCSIEEKHGIHKATGPLHKDYSTYEARLRSFKSWPVSLSQKPNVLSDAGFFYTGKGDQTVCFHCGGGLKDWEESDDPWEEHALWFSKCMYVYLVKGKAFIEKVHVVKQAKLTSKEVQELERSSPEPSQIVETPKESTHGEAVNMGSKDCNKSGKTDDARLCKICFTEELGVLFLPCGHIVACVHCAPSLSVCAVCRQPFTATVRAYLP